MALLDWWASWIVLAGVALGIAVTLSTLVYMLSAILNNDKMKTWAKMELVEIFYSAMIIALALFGLGLINSAVQGAVTLGGSGYQPMCGANVTNAWVPVVIGTTKTYQCLDICGNTIASTQGSVYKDIDGCHMRLGIWYLREIFDETKNFAFDIYLDYIDKSILQEFTINVEFLFEKAGFFTFTPWRGFFTMGNTVRQLVFEWAIKIMMLSKFQEIMLRFISTALFPALFVSGAVLRSFTFSRRLGGLLLAMGISLYFIFPTFYAFGALVMLDLKNRAYIDWMADTDANPNGIRDPPVANTMYTKGVYNMIGGSGKFETSKAKDYLADYEGLTDDAYYKYLEEGDPDYTLDFDLSADSQATDAEKVEGLKQARKSTETWFEGVSKESKFDQFINHAWEANGPIDTLSRLTFWSLFFSLFSVIGTIAGIRSLSMTFGGDIEIAGLTRLI
jgi:hypothetical protein